MEQVTRYLPDGEHMDELEGMLTWLTQHGGHPPTLRVKNCIKTILQIMDSNLLEQIENWYYNYARTVYLNRLETILELKHVTLVERQLTYPLQFVSDIIRAKPFNKLIFALRHYIIDQVPQMIDKCRKKIKHYLQEGDFTSCQEFVNWIDEANTDVLDTKNEVLQFLIEFLKDRYVTDINDNWDRNYLINDIYKKFINIDWLEFAKILKVSPKDSQLNKLLYQIIETKFIKLRTENIFDLVVNKYPESEPTLIELKNVINLDNQYKLILTNFLYQFQNNLLNPSITTMEILIGFIKSLKCFLIIDPTGNYASKITTFIKLNLHDREELNDILLYAILGINEKTLMDIPIAKIGGLDKLIDEMQDDDDFTINYDRFAQINGITNDNINHYNKFVRSPKKMSTVMRTDAIESSFNMNHFGDTNGDETNENDDDDSLEETSSFVYQEIMNQYLTWVPQVNSNKMNINSNFNNSLSKDRTNVIKFKHNLIDYMLSIVQDKSRFIDKLLQLMTQKLLATMDYKLELSWSLCYKELYEKIRIERIDMTDNDDDDDDDGTLNKLDVSKDSNNIANNNNNGGNIGGNNNKHLPIVTDDDDVTLNFNKINIMLNDLKTSEKISQKYNNQINNTTINNCPKFISSNYWKLPHNEHYHVKNDQLNQYRICDAIEAEMLKVTQFYQYVTNQRRVLRYHKDQTRFDVELMLQTGQLKQFSLTVGQYCIIEKFNGDAVELTIDELFEVCGMSRDQIQNELRWWVRQGVLRYDGQRYSVYE